MASLEMAGAPGAEGVILAVDDSATMRALVTLQLKPLGAVLTATSGPQALERLRSRRVRVLVTDWVMPGMDGLELLQELRGDPALAGTPVVFLCAAADQVRERALAAGALAVLQKGSPADVLRAAVAQALGDARSVAA
jgi:CheY-like chemotaxis protein